MADPYVLTFKPILKEKVWGGRRLAGLGKSLPEGTLVGESWEVADLASTSAGGGGGGAARSVIANGPLAGHTLHDAFGMWAPELLSGGGFPLLVKFLDAREHLSVQVHPSPAYARAHPEAHLKTECWYVLEAEPGSLIYKGVKPGVTRGAFEAALRAGQGEGVVELLDAVPAVVGDCHNLPSGTVHALGAGVMVAEVQTPSDTTFRVYDWAAEYGRAGRELHVEEALACMDFAPAAGAVRAPEGASVTRLVTTEFYAVDELGGENCVGIEDEGYLIAIGVGGAMRIEQAGQGATPLSRGGVALLPPGVSGHISVKSGARGLLFSLGESVSAPLE